MNAFVEIIEKLVESVLPHTWKKHPYFPFQFLINPQAKVFDICIFETNAQGACGFLWIEFCDFSDLYVMPFRLARYQDSNSLICLSPWSLQCIYNDTSFYESWRNALNHKNPLITAYKGTFFQRKYEEGASFVASNLGSDPKKTRVRIDCQTVYKIFHSLERSCPTSNEVEFLTYLGSQTVFSNFAKLTIAFEYSRKDMPRSHTAIATCYIQNNGTLFDHLVSLLQKSHLEEGHHEKIFSCVESLGRLVGDFHTAMGLAKEADLIPERTFDELKDKWLRVVSGKSQEKINEFLSFESYYPDHKNVFSKLTRFADDLFQKIKQHDDLGLRIRTHGNIQLEQILVGHETFILHDYDSEFEYDSTYRRTKQPCLHDIASLVASIKFAWFLTERTCSQPRSKNSSEHSQKKIDLFEIEHIFMRSYLNNLAENINAAHLLPKNKETYQDLYNFCLLNTILRESCQLFQQKDGRVTIWLTILEKCMEKENSHMDSHLVNSEQTLKM